MYTYSDLKHTTLNDDGQRRFLKVRDHVTDLLRKAGAVSMESAMSVVSGGSWEAMACVDRMVELGEIREIEQKDCAGQHRIFVKVGL